MNLEDRTFFLEGDERLVILMHAYTSSANDMYALGRALNREGFSVYGPTFSGHAGENMDDVLAYGPDDWVADARGFLAEMRDKGYQAISMFGLSLGGIMATKTLIDDDSLVAAGSFCSPLYDNTRGSNVFKNFDNIYKKTMPKEALTDEHLKQMHERLEATLNDLTTLVNDNMTPQYASITKPVFIAQGGQDQMISPTIASDYKDQLVNAEVSYHYYEDAPHYITIGRYGKELQADFIPFLKQLNWNRGNDEQ